MAMTTSKTVYRSGHARCLRGILVAPFPDPLADDEDAEVVEALRGVDHLLATMTAPAETAAMILEPVLGEGGYAPAPAAFLDGLVERCRRHGILFVADEVQSGFGRTAKLFAVEHHRHRAGRDLHGQGHRLRVPVRRPRHPSRARRPMAAGSHGGTYGGNPIGCAAALATIDVLTAPEFLDNVNARGRSSSTACVELQADDAGLRQVRGVGLMVATVFDDPGRSSQSSQHCLREGRLILMSAGTDGTALRWMPPLVVTAAEIDEALPRSPPPSRRRPDRPPTPASTRRDGMAGPAVDRRRARADHRRGRDGGMGCAARLVRRARRLSASAGRPGRVTSRRSCASSGPASSRRLDRLEEEGWGPGSAEVTDDHRGVVVVELTSGAGLWREMNVTYRRAVQAHGRRPSALMRRRRRRVERQRRSPVASSGSRPLR